MIPEWTIFGSIAVFMWVLGTFFDKYLLERYFGNNESDDEGGPGALMIFSAYFSFIVALAIYFYGFSEISFDLTDSILGMVVGVMNGSWILLYLYTLNRTSVSKVVPIFQLVPIFGIIFSSILLGEFLFTGQIAAIGLLMVGALVLLHYKKNSFFRIDLYSLGLMIAATSLVALSETVFKVAALQSNFLTTAFWTSAGFTLFGVFLFFFVEKYQTEFADLVVKRTKQIVSANSTNEIIDNTAELIFFFAVTLGPVALVQSLNAYQPIIALAFGLMLGLVMPKYFKDESSEASIMQNIIGILLITVASIYLYSII